MADGDAWSLGYARQADADSRMWGLKLGASLIPIGR
jgi:hypothetical protein